MRILPVVWRDVPGYEGIYKVSNAGRVKSVRKGITLTIKLTTKGYVYADLARNGVKKRASVHRLVATVFLGRPTFERAIVNHLDGDKQNNTPSNLEWTTHRGNAQHAMLRGLANPTGSPGENNGRAKLTRQQVAEIRALKGVVGQRPLAKRYGVSRSAIQFIHQGKHWK